MKTTLTCNIEKKKQNKYIDIRDADSMNIGRNRGRRKAFILPKSLSGTQQEAGWTDGFGRAVEV